MRLHNYLTLNRLTSFLTATHLVIHYIWVHNPWWMFPLRVLFAVSVQLIMFITHQPFSIRLWNERKLLLFPGSSVTNMFLYTNRPDELELDLLRQYCTAETLFLDVGAHLGTYSVQLADRTTHIYGFEADGKCAQKCRLNYALNGLDENQVINKAVAARLGKLRFYLDAHDGTQNTLVKQVNSKEVEVDAISIDEFLKNLPTDYTSVIMKIDVEGAEEDVIKGAIKTLKNSRVPVIIFESFQPHTSPLFTQLKELSYKIKKVSQNNYCAIKRS